MKRFGKRRPDAVTSVEERARLEEQKKAAKRDAKRRDDDELDEAELAALEASIERGWEQVKAGKLIPAEELLKKLRSLG